MAWVEKGGRSYEYRSFRRGGRVTSEYVGGGPVPPEVARFSRMMAEGRRLEREADREAQEGIDARDAEVAGLGRHVGSIVAAILGAAGYHRPKRGGWRKKRGNTMPGVSLEVLKKAQGGDESVVQELEDALDADPELLARVTTGVYDLAHQVGEKAIAVHCGKNLLARVAISRKVEAIRSELAGANPTAIERMLAQRAALDWLALHLAEPREEPGDGTSIAQADYLARRVDRLHRRYLSSLKALAQVRKLDLTAIQVNVDMGARV